MGTTIIAVIGTILGIFSGFLLNELSGIIRQRREDKRALNRALFRLLVLHHLTAPVNIENFCCMIEEWIKEQDSTSSDKVKQEQLHSHVCDIIDKCLVPIRAKALDDEYGQYEKAMLDIASRYPILAFALLGRSRSYADINEYLKSLFDLIESKESSQSNTKKMLRTTREFYECILNENLEDEILYVAKKIGLRVKFRIQRYLRDRNQDVDTEFKQKLFNLLDRLYAMSE